MTHVSACPSDQFHTDRHTDAQGVVLTLRGELDLASAPALEHELSEIEATGPGRVLIDLSGLDFMDCAGLGVLLRAQRNAHTGGWPLQLRRPARQVQRLFVLTGLVDRFVFSD
jgi:anti-sigma B factor antagonist